MKKVEYHKLTIHISYANEMTLCALEDSIHLLNAAFAEFCERNHAVLSETNEISPKVTSVSNGSLVVDVIVPISCTLLSILYDIIKNKFDSQKDFAVNVNKTGNKTYWLEEDTYNLSRKVLEEYVLGNGNLSINDFIHTLSLLKPYGSKSIRSKIQNTKYLIECKQIPNTLKISKLKNCSTMHVIQFNKACEDLNI